MTDGTSTTPGLVCAHHHLYSTLARGMPSPPGPTTTFMEILDQVWWRLDAELDLEMLYWSAALGALEALESGTTAIIDHHESPHAIEGSLEVIARACADVGVRVRTCYGATDRWDDRGRLRHTVDPVARMSRAARRGLEECERHIRAGGDGMVGLHAAFTCSDETIEAAAALASELGTGVHVHVAEGQIDADAGARLARHANDDWLLVHAVHLKRPLRGTVVHNPRSNLNNAVGYARPAGKRNPVALGTDGIGADMLEEARIAFAVHRSHDVTASPDTAWSWLATGWDLVPEARADRVTWSYGTMNSAWHLAYTTDIRPLTVLVDGETVLHEGRAVRVDADEVRAKSAEQAARLHRRLAA